MAPSAESGDFMQQAQSTSDMFLALVERNAAVVSAMAKVFRDAEDFMINSLFADTPLSDEMSSYLAGKQDVALTAISALTGQQDLELIRHHIREGDL
jgi:hypothetical protein